MRGAPWLALAGCALLPGCAPQPPAADGFRFPERPNVVLFVVDTLRRDHLGVYGYERPTSPFLDRLARQGIVVENAWAQAPQTFLSTATLMVSRRFPLTTANDGFQPIPGLAPEHQARHARVQHVHDVNVTLAETLREAGYATLGVFTNPHHHPTSGFWQGFDEAVYLEPESGHRPYGRAVDVHGRFFEWLDGRGSTAVPFFAYLHVMEVHNPYVPPQALRKIFTSGHGRDVFTTGRPDVEPSAADLDYTRGLYDGEIRFVDGVVEALVQSLQERGLWASTLLVLTSDHGDELMEHGGLGHGLTLFHEQIRVPILFAGAGLERHPAAGRRLGGVVRNLDLAPTLADAAGAGVPPSFEGESLLPRLRDANLGTPPQNLAYARNPSLRSVTDGRWHLIVDMQSGEKQLYDLEKDPGEEHDVAADRPGEVRRLARRIAALEKEHRAAEHLARSLEGGGELDAETVEQLKALGYLE